MIAFSSRDIQDVTWRYSADHEQLLMRRNECREEWLVNTILQLRKERQLRFDPTELKQLQEMTSAELVEMMTIKSASGEELAGRTTGSYEWRLVRGELGKTEPDWAPYVIVPTKIESEKKLIDLMYSCAKNEYNRVSNDNEKTAGWKSCVFDSKHVFRKEETDWKMVYLARLENSNSGSVSWKVDLGGDGFVVDWINVEVHSTCFQSGVATWKLTGNDTKSVSVAPGSVQTVEALSGCSSVCLTVELAGGEGSVAWQHAQLFRQALDETEQFPFHLQVFFKSII